MESGRKLRENRNQSQEEGTWITATCDGLQRRSVLLSWHLTLDISLLTSHSRRLTPDVSLLT